MRTFWCKFGNLRDPVTNFDDPATSQFFDLISVSIDPAISHVVDLIVVKSSRHGVHSNENPSGVSPEISATQ
jgi:hypothetical protein